MLRAAVFLLGCLLAKPALGQLVITPDDAVSAALQNHPLARAAAFDVQARQFGHRAAGNLPNPEVNAESPTGEFYTVGVLQSFDFPTVYARQKQVARAETGLAEAGQLVGLNDLRQSVRRLYLQAQVAEYRARQWVERDSLYQAIAAAAGRQFEAGEIDFLQKTLAENEAGNVHQERLAAEQNAALARQQLTTYAGLPAPGTLLPLSPDTAGLVLIPDVSASPVVRYEQQAVQVAEKQAGLARSRALPGFSLGYLNQGARSTPIDYRFRATVGIPLWTGQYRAGRKAAESEVRAAQSRAAAQQQTVEMGLQRAQTEAASALVREKYYRQEALPRSLGLIDAATRMREAGQIDYVVYLRTLDEAFDIRRDYAAQVLILNEARIEVLYLSGR